jgi:hypothetical protein
LRRDARNDEINRGREEDCQEEGGDPLPDILEAHFWTQAF